MEFEIINNTFIQDENDLNRNQEKTTKKIKNMFKRKDKIRESKYKRVSNAFGNFGTAEQVSTLVYSLAQLEFELEAYKYFTGSN